MNAYRIGEIGSKYLNQNVLSNVSLFIKILLTNTVQHEPKESICFKLNINQNFYDVHLNNIWLNSANYSKIIYLLIKKSAFFVVQKNTILAI